MTKKKTPTEAPIAATTETPVVAPAATENEASASQMASTPPATPTDAPVAAAVSPDSPAVAPVAPAPAEAPAASTDKPMAKVVFTGMHSGTYEVEVGTKLNAIKLNGDVNLSTMMLRDSKGRVVSANAAVATGTTDVFTAAKAERG